MNRLAYSSDDDGSVLDKHGPASVTLSVNWSDDHAAHEEQLHVESWFPTKAIRLWRELHEFERVGMVTQWLQQAGFTDLHTLSSRGWPRPADDPHADKTPYSDPVYAVWGCKPEQ